MVTFIVWLLVFGCLSKIFNAVKQIKEERNEAQEKLKKANEKLDQCAKYEDYLEGELEKTEAEKNQYLELCKAAYEQVDDDIKELTIEQFESWIYFTDGKLD